MKKNRTSILVTGAAGFIGFHLTKFLIQKGFNVIGVDNLNNYYSSQLKRDRLKQISSKKFKFFKININNKKKMKKIFEKFYPKYVINLAAQVGIRNSLKKPKSYIINNVIGFFNVLELSKNFDVKHLVYASSSSVYGLNFKYPFSVKGTADHPLTVYGMSKRSNELMAHVYSYLYKLPTTGLRFFTVYGPWGRPDMALFKFVKNILKRKKIDLYNYGNHYRDFTYIQDVVEVVYRTLRKKPKFRPGKKPSSFESFLPWKIYNISSGRPIHLRNFIKEIEKKLKKKAFINNLPKQKGDIAKTHGDMKLTISSFKYKPKTHISKGISHFIKWYKKYYKIVG